MSDNSTLLSAVIIDDEPQIRKLLRASLSSENYTVYEAENGQLGLMEIAFRKPDIVLLDLGLPDIDGVEVIRRLRNGVLFRLLCYRFAKALTTKSKRSMPAQTITLQSRFIRQNFLRA